MYIQGRGKDEEMKKGRKGERGKKYERRESEGGRGRKMSLV